MKKADHGGPDRDSELQTNLTPKDIIKHQKGKLLINIPCYYLCDRSQLDNKPRPESKKVRGWDVNYRGCFVVDRCDCQVYHLSSDRHVAFYGPFEVLYR